jgi:hypothetical protein
MRTYMHFLAPHYYKLLIFIGGKIISKEFAEINKS